MPNDEKHVVGKGCIALNFRSRPVVRPGTVILPLPEGHEVTKIEAVADDQAWWHVSTVVDGQQLPGYLAHRFLYTAAEWAAMQPADDDIIDEPVGIGEAHLRENRPNITRARAGGQAFPLGETNRPGRDAATAEGKAAELTAIVDWLDVENSGRYLRVGSITYCNIYAHDYCYLAGAYLPRVWWFDRVIVRLAAGERVSARWSETVREMTANDLLDWLKKWGGDFGWQRTFDMTVLQTAVNEGKVAVVCAQRKARGLPGHIAAVVPETAEHKARRLQDGQTVAEPLQSQAGWTNVSRGFGGHSFWWRDNQYHEFGFWIHP